MSTYHFFARQNKSSRGKNHAITHRSETCSKNMQAQRENKFHSQQGNHVLTWSLFFWILSVWKIWSNEKNIIEKTSTWFLLFTVLLHVFYTCFGHCMFYMFLHVFWTMHDFNMFLHAFLNNECVLQFFLIMRVYLNVLCMFVRALDRIMEFFRIQM